MSIHDELAERINLIDAERAQIPWWIWPKDAPTRWHVLGWGAALLAVIVATGHTLTVDDESLDALKRANWGTGESLTVWPYSLRSYVTFAAGVALSALCVANIRRAFVHVVPPSSILWRETGIEFGHVLAIGWLILTIYHVLG